MIHGMDCMVHVFLFSCRTENKKPEGILKDSDSHSMDL